MALKDKLDETKLRSLTYGDNTPYVTVNIDNQKVTSNGKVLNVSNNGTIINSALIDTSRITAFLEDKPWWSTKQVYLQLTNIKPNFGFRNGRGGLLVTPSASQLYTPANTLAQVAAQGTGAFHFERWGLLPGVGATYEELKLREDTSSKNPLIKFKDKLIVDPISNSPYEPIYSYMGGPGTGGSGIISTIIKRYQNSLLSIKNNDESSNGFVQQPWDGGNEINPWALGYGKPINYITLTQGVSKIYQKKTKNDRNINPAIDTGSFNNTVTPPYLDQNINLAFSASSPTFNPLFNIYVTQSSYTTKDNYQYSINNALLKQPNELKLTYTNNNLSESIQLKSRENYYKIVELKDSQATPPSSTGDIIDFYFEALNSDNIENFVQIPFQAYLTDLTDSVNSKWEGIQYSGRAETLYAYNGFNRTISFSFKVAAHKKDDMEKIYDKLNYLMSNMAGDYNGDLLRGSFMALTIGKYITRQPGIIEALTYKVSNDTSWDIDKNLPHIIDVNVTFIPIGVSGSTSASNILPRKGTNLSFINQP